MPKTLRGDLVLPPNFEVNVPIHDPAHPDRRGVHVFTGRATGTGDALIAAFAAWYQARQCAATGTQIPTASSSGWSARGLRSGWDLHWDQATTRLL